MKTTNYFSFKDIIKSEEKAQAPTGFPWKSSFSEIKSLSLLRLNATKIASR
jgi:hypothetical protein